MTVTGITDEVTLESGDSNLTVDAGIVAEPVIPATVGDTIFLDKDGDGIQDAGEEGIAGVTVDLKDEDGNVLRSTVTDSNGNYQFVVDPGTYSLGVTAPRGMKLSPLDQGGNDSTDSDFDPSTNMTANFTVAEGEDKDDVDGGLFDTAELGDHVFLDENGNGQQDGGEDNVAGVTVNLLDEDGNVVDTTTTDSNGDYLFEELNPGTYSVQFVAPEGFDFTDANVGDDATDSDANDSGFTDQVTLESGDSNLTVDAGIVAEPVIPATVGDTIFLDKDGDGIQDAGEEGIAGVTVDLKDEDGNVLRSTVTDSNGNYQFVVDPGTYSLGVTAPRGMKLSPLDQGGNDSTDSDFDPSTNMTANFTVAEGEDKDDVDGGLFDTAELGDHVFLDENGNGQQDGGEDNVAGVTVNLLDEDGNVVDTTTTDSNGDYLFEELNPGTYSVQFVAPEGFDFTDANVGDDATDSDANDSGFTDQVTLESGDSNLTVDAGIVAEPVIPATVGDTIFLDKDGDGIQDAGEEGIAGVTVDLKDEDGNVLRSTVTDSNGNYQFVVDPGTYSLGVTAPRGMKLSPLDQGGNDSTDSDFDPSTNMTANFTVAEGEDKDDVDGGLFDTAELGDHVFLDENGNGQQDGGEDNVAGVTVNLLDEDGNVVDTTTTDSNGDYLFEELNPGTYSVQFVAPEGFDFTDANVGDDATDSDANDSGFTDQVTLESGDSNLTVDAGIVAEPVIPATVGDTIFEDKNANGIQDAGEEGIAGVTVHFKRCKTVAS